MSKPTPKAALRKLEARDGHECAWHGVSCGTDTLVPQHRQGGMGGSPLKHRLSNIVWLCSRMNGDIESDADLAMVARERGIKVGFQSLIRLSPQTLSNQCGPCRYGGASGALS